MVSRARRLLWGAFPAALIILVPGFWLTSPEPVRGASPGAPPASPWKERPVKFRLANGLNGFYQHDMTSAVTVVVMFISGGKRDVPAGKDGLGYLATRLGVEIPDPDTARLIISQATRMKVSVAEDYAVISLQCLSENLEPAVKVASELIQGRIFSGLRIEHNKESMALLGRAGEDDAVQTGHRAAFKAFFQGRGYGSADYGTEESLKGLTKKDIIAYDRRHLVKGGLLFSVCSDLDKEKVLKLLEQNFTKIPEGESASDENPLPASCPSDRKVVLVKDAKQSYVARVFLCPFSPAAPGVFAKACLAEAILGKGAGSRLWALRAAHELAYSVNARLTWTRICGLMECYLETEKAKRDKAVESLDNVLKVFFDQGVTADELDMAKALARTEFLRFNEAKEPRCLSLGHFEILGLGADYFSAVFDDLKAVTPEDMNAFIKTVFSPEASLLVVVGGGAGSPRL